MPADRIFPLLAGLALTGAFFFSPTIPQQAPAPPTIELELAAGVGAPGQVVVLPLILHLYGEERTSRLEAEVALPRPHLEVKAVRLGENLEEEKAELEWSLEDSERGRLLRIQLHSPLPLPEGQIGRLVISLSEEAAEETLLLTLSAKVPGEAGAEAREIGSLDGILVISSTAARPAVGCFFYMH